MQLQQRINAFAKLGSFLNEYLNFLGEKTDDVSTGYLTLQNAINKAQAHNGWFTQENIVFSLTAWADALTLNNLQLWTSNYSFLKNTTKNVAVIMAGNIPLVGFHDFISVLITGHNIIVKQSSNDAYLLPVLTQKLIEIEPLFKNKIIFSSEKLQNFDAVIATGSNNSAKYFEYYFGKHPHIIRKNRNSIAILTGNETKKELLGLANDIFRYYGLGCRNVSKIYIPEDYNFDPFFNAMYSWKSLINQSKYMNNYDYNKAVYLMSDIALLDNGFMLLKEDTGFSSPISVIYYETYKNRAKLFEKLNQEEEKIQCVVSSNTDGKAIAFGTTQHPKLWDYADGVDTLLFLSGL